MTDKKDTIKNTIIIVLILVIVCGGMFFASSGNGASGNDKQDDTIDIETKAQEESAAVSENEMKEFNDINFSRYMEMYNGDTDSLVLIARPDCHYCQIAEPIIKNISYKYDLTINHLNTNSLSDEEQADLVRSNDYFKEFGTPTLLVVSNGEINNKLEGLTISDYYIEFLENTGFISK